MKLAEWIKAERLTRTEVADQLGITPSYVTNLCSDAPNWPSRDVLVRIIELTNGNVTADDFLPDEDAAA